MLPDPLPEPEPTPVQSPVTSTGEIPTHRRRVRYAGSHPRRFAEKYKEKAPEQYAADVARIIASGKTPAGSHRSILVPEILETLEPQAGQTLVDCTLGYGGHAREILARLGTDGRLVGFDCDPVELPKTTERLRQAGWSEAQFIPVRSNFAGLGAGLASLGILSVDGILADLGVSSMQLDDPARGFTYKDDGPLDLRMNPAKGLSAAQWLARATPSQLATALRDNADEPMADALSEAVITALQTQPVTRTREFARLLHELYRGRGWTRDKAEGDARIRRFFQALRIEVNDEFGVLEALLRQLPTCLKPGGRVAILTFHSGEDRRVKQAFAEGQRQGLYTVVSDSVRRPGPEELRSNPRSAPAKLRWAIRSDLGSVPR
jgi:16S rRNA (cytosine1402-N4)-methyltransferase